MTAAPTLAGRPRLLSGERRLPTLGLLLVVTLVAFEALAVATVMPTTARALHGLSLYSFGFTAFLVASLVGIVDAGARTDRRGPTGVLVAGLVAFAVGLVICGLAPSMPVFIAGRAVSGFGAGAIIVSIYVVVARAYDEALRPRVFAALSAAWVVPALVGPAIAGAVTEHVGWRWVFAGLPPFIVLGSLLLAPALASLPPRVAPDVVRRAPVGAALVLASGVVLVQLAGTRATPVRLLLGLAGLGLLAAPLRRLLPPGTMRIGRGLPAAIAFRGLLAGAFFGAEAFLPLTLTTVHGYRPTLAGLPLTFGAVGWTLGSTLQGRQRRANPRLLRAGFGLVAVGVGCLAALAAAPVPGWVAVPLWIVAGTGMGLAMPTVSVLTLDLSPQHEQGINTAALQISDGVGGATMIAVGGALVTAAGVLATVPLGIATVDILLGLVAATGAALATRVVVRR